MQRLIKQRKRELAKRSKLEARNRKLDEEEERLHDEGLLRFCSIYVKEFSDYKKQLLLKQSRINVLESELQQVQQALQIQIDRVNEITKEKDMEIAAFRKVYDAKLADLQKSERSLHKEVVSVSEKV